MVSSRSVLALVVAVACGVAGGREVGQHQQRHLETQDGSQAHQPLAAVEYGQQKPRDLRGSPKSSLPVEPYPVEYGYKSAKKSSRSSGSKSRGGKNKGNKTKSHKGHRGGAKSSSYDGEYYEKKSDKSPKAPKGDGYDDYGGHSKSSKKDKSDKVKKSNKGDSKNGYGGGGGSGFNILDDDETMNPDRIVEEEIDLNLRIALRDGAGSFGGIEAQYPDLIDITERIAELAIEGVVKRTLQLRQNNRMLVLEVDVLDTGVSDSFNESKSKLPGLHVACGIIFFCYCSANFFLLCHRYSLSKQIALVAYQKLMHVMELP